MTRELTNAELAAGIAARLDELRSLRQERDRLKAALNVEALAKAAYEHPAWGHKQPWDRNPWARQAWISCVTDILEGALSDEVDAA